jgi:hypothetical protein
MICHLEPFDEEAQGRLRERSWETEPQPVIASIQWAQAADDW